MAPDVDVPLVTSLVKLTLQTTLLPPPVTIPLHWLIEETSWFDVVTVVVQPAGGSTPAAAKHAVAVIVETGCARGSDGIGDRDVAGCFSPAPVGKAGGLHWVAAGAVAAEATAGAKVTPNQSVASRGPVPAATVASRQRGTTAALDGALEWMASPVRPRLMRSERRQELRKR